MPYLAVEKAVLSQFAFQNRDLVPEAEEVSSSHTALLKAEIAEARKKIDNLVRLAETMNDMDMVVTRISTLKADIAKREEALAVLQKPALTVADGFKTGQWYEDLGNLEGEAKVELRRKIQASIRRFLHRVEMDPGRMVVALTYASGKVREMDVTPFLEKVGGARHPR